MPAKKKRTSTRQITHISVATQTEDNFNDGTAISDCKEQIVAMTKKIADYEATILKLQGQNDILKQQNNKLSKSSVVVPANNELAEKIKEKSISPDIGNKSTKGCSCKGACANKICGCVKKGISCNKKLCKCNDIQCQNQFQESEKENATAQNALSQDGQKALEKLGRLTLNQEVLHASEKKRKNLFSDSKNMLNIEKYAASPLGTRRRLFKQDSEEIVDVSVPESNSLFQDRECPSKPEITFPQTPIAKRNRRLKNKDEPLKIVLTIDDIQLQPSSNATSTDEIFLPKIAKVIHSPIDQNKLKPMSPENFVARRKYRDEKVFKRTASISSNEELDEMKDAKGLISSGRVQHSPKPQVPFLENVTENSLLPGSSSTDSNTALLDVSLNPMVPKRQLLRSPIGAVGNIPLSNESKRFSPPKKELAVAEVDWVQHQSELIMCKICKRKFFPHRIDKHVASCKGI